MVVDVHDSKANLRAEILARRKLLTPEEAGANSAAIAAILYELPIFINVTTLCSYLDFNNEVQTAEIICTALAHGKRVALPRTHKAERRLTLHPITSLDGLAPGPYGILEPPADAPEIAPAEIELFLVPGAAFDATGNRIGYGAGFYDGLLGGCPGWRVALAYGLQVAPYIPARDHDIPMDVIITEAGLLDCRQARETSDHLRLRNMIFYGHHGAFPQEREHGIRLAVDVDLKLDLQMPGLTDDLHTTVNYPAIYRLIERIQSERNFHLFETLATHIADGVLRDFPPVRQVTVRARKFNPPVGGLMDAFEVEIIRSRPDWSRPPRP